MRDSSPTEVIIFSALWGFVAFIDAVSCFLWIKRRHMNPIKPRPVWVTFAHRGQFLAVSIICLSRIYPQTFGCNFYFLGWVFLCYFGMSSDFFRAAIVHHKYFSSKHAIHHNSQTDLNLRSNYLKQSKKYSHKNIAKGQVIMFIGYMTLWLMMSLLYSPFGSVSVSESNCSSGPLTIYSFCLIMVIIIFPVMGFMNFRLRFVEDNFGMKAEFGRMGQLMVFMIILWSSDFISVIHDFNIDYFNFIDLIICICSSIACVNLITYPAIQTYSKYYQITDDDATLYESNANISATESIQKKSSKPNPTTTNTTSIPGTNVDGDVVNSLESFVEMLNNPKMAADFEEFLIKEFSVENYMFWKAVNKFDRHSGNDLHGIGLNIYSDYIENDAPFMINISGKCRNQLESLFKQNPVPPVPAKFFDMARKEVQFMMFNDSYRRYRINIDRKAVTLSRRR